MSNALYGQPAAVRLADAATSGAAAEAASRPIRLDAPATSAMLAVVAVGVCVLAVWVIRRIARPAKLSLANTPGRGNTIHPAHIIMLLMAWLGSSFAAQELLGFVWPGGLPQAGVLAGLFGQVVWLVASLGVAAVTFRNGFVRGMGLSVRHWMYDTGRGVMAYFAAIPVCFGLVTLSAYVFQAIHGQPSPNHEMLTILDEVTVWWRVLVIFSAVVMAALAEEVFCRGLLQSMLRRYTARPWLAIVLSSAFFSLMHLTAADDGKTIVWTPVLPMFALGIVLGYNYERSGRLLAPILTHAVFNAVSVGIYMYAQG